MRMTRGAAAQRLGDCGRALSTGDNAMWESTPAGSSPARATRLLTKEQ